MCIDKFQVLETLGSSIKKKWLYFLFFAFCDELSHTQRYPIQKRDMASILSRLHNENRQN